jgi:hypothetical protein
MGIGTIGSLRGMWSWDRRGREFHGYLNGLMLFGWVGWSSEASSNWYGALVAMRGV